MRIVLGAPDPAAFFGSLGAVAGYLSLLGHFNSVARGVIDTRDVLYYLSVTGFFLFLTVKAVETGKWRWWPWHRESWPLVPT